MKLWVALLAYFMCVPFCDGMANGAVQKVANIYPEFGIFVRNNTGEARKKGEARTYYFRTEETKYDFKFESGRSVCEAKVKSNELITDDQVTTDSKGKVTVYFICYNRCCGSGCCRVNLGIILMLLITVVVLLTWLVFFLTTWNFQRRPKTTRKVSPLVRQNGNAKRNSATTTTDLENFEIA